MLLNILFCLIVGYIFGCFSTGYLIGKINKIDIRNFGSGNAGTTNAMRTLGVKAGILTFIGDALKALIPLLIIRFYIFSDNDLIIPLLLITGLGAVLGHNFPFWLRFKGGKGIAVTGGVMLAYDWRLGLIAFGVFMIITLITKYVSVGSLALSLLFPIWMLIMHPGEIHMLLLSLGYTILAFLKHRSNIKRLLSGTENKIGQKVKINNG